MHKGSKLYFDIETTGLSWRSSHVTVIGCAYENAKGLQIKQFVSGRPNDEAELIEDFSEFAKGFDTLVHFNGKTFDIPYIKSKCEFYHLPSPFTDYAETDLYKRARKISKLLSLDDYRQKSLETYFRFNRQDRISGKECIKAYQDYVTKGDESALHLLTLHNEDDLKGMAFIEGAIKGYEDFLQGGFTVAPCGSAADSNCSSFNADNGTGSSLILNLKLESSLAAPLDIEETGDEKHAPFKLHVDGDEGKFLLPSYNGTLKYFFKDYKNYFYLPLEGRAIHSSIGQFVDRNYKEKAKKETAFEPTSGIFYPQQKGIILPEFKASYGDKFSYFRLEDIKNSCAYKELAAAALKSYI